MRILLVGDANSIFFVHYVKALKKQMDAEIHVYSPIARNQNYSEYPYDKVFFDDYELKKCSRIRFVSTFFNPYVMRMRFGKFLRHNGIHYDIIHFHWIIPAWVICPKAYHRYADKICMTLWGGETKKLQLLKSHEFYLSKLKRFMKNADIMISGISTTSFFERFPMAKDITRYGVFGSSIIDALSKDQSDKNECKNMFGVENDRITVMLGYSGKALHNQDKILKEIAKHAGFEQVRDKLHFILPMTRGSEESFLESLERLLKNNQCHYTMIKGKYMSDEDVVKLRKATDIIFQLSDFDGVSSSIKESLCAGTVMISGYWFAGYHVLKDMNFKYLEVKSIKEGVEKFYEVVENMEFYQDFVKNNENVGKQQFSWEYCIKNWIKVYKEITN